MPHYPIPILILLIPFIIDFNWWPIKANYIYTRLFDCPGTEVIKCCNFSYFSFAF